MVRLLSEFLVVFAVILSSGDLLLNKAILSLFICTMLSSGQEVEYSYVSGVRTEIEPPTAKVELAVMLDPEISDDVDTNYAETEFCRLFAEVQEVFDTVRERRIIVEFSALFYGQNATDTSYIDDNVVFEENGTIDVVGTLGDLADMFEQWDQRYDIYLFLTRRPLVALFENKTIANLAGYSVPGGACRPGENIGIAQYSYRNIMHQITHLLGAVHLDDTPPNPNTQCKEGNYTNIVVGEDAYVHWIKGFANCTKQYMIEFLKNPNVTCLYSEDILDQLDCGSVVPEIG